MQLGTNWTICSQLLDWDKDAIAAIPTIKHDALYYCEKLTLKTNSVKNRNFSFTFHVAIRKSSALQ